MDVRQKPSGLVGVGYVLTCIGFFGALVTAGWLIVNSLVLPVVLDDHTITFRTAISSKTLESPPNVELDAPIPVRVDLEDATIGEGAQALGTMLVPIAVVAIVSFLLMRIVDSVRRGDPFTTDNVRRLRAIGFTLLIGVSLGQLVGQVLGQHLVEIAGVDSPGFSLAIGGPLAVAGIGVLILAEVFGHGVRLREDVEGTV